MKPAIVVVAYNRARSLYRLLDFVGKAYYEEDNIPLIISIDKGDNKDVLEVAESFVWKHGDKIVAYQEENLKLRKHILKCGDLSKEYGSVIVLEDDLIVSPFFYQYATKALEFSSDKEYIAGISLYNHRWNVNVSEPFEIADDQYDGWYFQFASSWGQAWTEKQWTSFKSWYEENESKDLYADDMPDFVASWSNSSWLKYFIKYVIEKNQFFLYPKKSLTSNFSDAGTHVSCDNTNYQVPLQERVIDYIFPELENSNCVYDAFFENYRLVKDLGHNREDFALDLYGSKTKSSHHYILSRRILNYKILKCYGCSLRPHENNIKYNVSGADFFLYDTTQKEINPYKYNAKRKAVYNHRYIVLKEYLNIFATMIDLIKTGIRKRIKRGRK